MNYIKILCFSAVITGLGSIVSCGDAKYDTLDTHASSLPTLHSI